MRGISRRRLLTLATQSATLAGAIAIGLPQRAGASPVPVDPVVAKPATNRPIRTVHEILPGLSNDAIALTIDDGPDPVWTPPMLDLLHSTRTPATFSLIGAKARTHPDLVKRIIAEGHGVCNHSMSHPQPFGARTAAAIHQQIADAQAAIADAGGVTPTLFRAPGGDWTTEVLTAVVGLHVVPLGWDIDPRDWSRPGAATVSSRLLAARGGDILLCHDGGGDRSQTIESLRAVLPVLKARGLQFVTL